MTNNFYEDKIQQLSDRDFKTLRLLADAWLECGNTAAKNGLNKICARYGFTGQQFLEWWSE